MLAGSRYGPLLGRGMGRSVAAGCLVYAGGFAVCVCSVSANCCMPVASPLFSRDLLPRGFLVYFYILLVVVWPTPGSRHGTLSSCRMWCICMVSRKQTKYTRCDAPMCLYCIQIGIWNVAYVYRWWCRRRLQVRKLKRYIYIYIHIYLNLVVIMSRFDMLLGSYIQGLLSCLGCSPDGGFRGSGERLLISVRLYMWRFVLSRLPRSLYPELERLGGFKEIWLLI